MVFEVDLRDNHGADARSEAPMPDAIDEDPQNMILADNDTDRGSSEEESEDEESPPDLHRLGSDFQNIGLWLIFHSLEYHGDIQKAAPIVLYLLYPELRCDIIKRVRGFLKLNERLAMWLIEKMFASLASLGVAEQIEREHADKLLEFVDAVGVIMMAPRRDHPRQSLLPIELRMRLDGPLGLVVAAKLLQYAQSVEAVKQLIVRCDYQHRAFRPNELQQLNCSFLNLTQLKKLSALGGVQCDLLMELCAVLKYHENLSCLLVDFQNNAQVLPNESRLIRNIQHLSSLETLQVCRTLLGESTVYLFSSEASFTELHLQNCSFLVDGDKGRGPSELPLAVALASNSRLERLSFESVQGSIQFYQGIEHGLLKNRTLQYLRVVQLRSPEEDMIPEFAVISWAQSVRLHPSLRKLELYMYTWSSRVTNAVCSLVRDNSSLRSIELVLDVHAPWGNDYDPEWIGGVLEALQANRTLSDVCITAGSDFGDRNWDRLATLLTDNSSIQTINFDAGRVSIPERLVALLQRVKSNRTLKRLNVEHSTFHHCHASALVDVLSDNYVLASLVRTRCKYNEKGFYRDFYPIHCSDEGWSGLLEGILDLNYYGRNYLRTQPNSVSHGVTLLSHVSSNLDAVYFHIRENPRLCDRREWK